MDEEKRKSVERGYKQLRDGEGEIVSDDDSFWEELRREIVPIDKRLLDRCEKRVDGVDVDLDEPLDADDD